MALIPLTDFDQSKLESLLRTSGIVQVREEAQSRFVRKHYTFPEKLGSFQLNCHGDHYQGAPVPSYKNCLLSVTTDRAVDEVKFEIVNPGFESLKLYSTERVYGRSFDGEYRQLFRYMFDCSISSCQLTFASKDQ